MKREGTVSPGASGLLPFLLLGTLEAKSCQFKVVCRLFEVCRGGQATVATSRKAFALHSLPAPEKADRLAAALKRLWTLGRGSADSKAHYWLLVSGSAWPKVHFAGY